MFLDYTITLFFIFVKYYFEYVQKYPKVDTFVYRQIVKIVVYLKHGKQQYSRKAESVKVSFMKKMFYVIVKLCNACEYVLTVEAESNVGAEHIILDKGYCGIHDYTVQAAQAFSLSELNTDCFTSALRFCRTTNMDEITKIIKNLNMFMKEKDTKEKRKAEIEKQIKALQKELESL